MLTQILRPMVRTQIQLLANSHATRSTLVNTITQWLGFLGVRATVTHLETASNEIRLCLTVGKPEACDNRDWQQIVFNLKKSAERANSDEIMPQMTPQQQSKLYRLLAYLIQVGNPQEQLNWDLLYPQLQALGLDDETLIGIRSALKVPQSIHLVMEGIDPDLAAIALPKAVSIAMLDRQVNSGEDRALTALLQAMKQPASGE